jgi:WD40 repeat protein
VAFHPNGRFLISASNDSTIKIWDLRQGHILYTLYGHEGASTSVNFSPCGDYFCSAGIDSVVMVWKSNLNEFESELIEDLGGVGNNSSIVPSPGAYGGITSNRKPKAPAVATQQISPPTGNKVSTSGRY